MRWGPRRTNRGDEKCDYELVIPLRNANIIPSGYTFRRKRNEDRKITRHKARLITKGYEQRHGIDYFETYAPTVRPATLRILLSLAAQKSASVDQADVKNAYLNAPLKDGEEIYMKLPPLYNNYRKLPPELEGKEGVVCQQAYVEQILAHFGLEDACPASTPM